MPRALSTLEKFKNTIVAGHFGFIFLGKLDQGNHMINVTPSFTKSFFLNVFRPH